MLSYGYEMAKLTTSEDKIFVVATISEVALSSCATEISDIFGCVFVGHFWSGLWEHLQQLTEETFYSASIKRCFWAQRCVSILLELF